jgi:alkanesulfonate monooxygenase SsuD/methylene tetrahydromethanopterin reductase-like flavin-dependent oxidoreductase (luciferase family)
MDLSTMGVFSFLDGMSGSQIGPFARRVERLGYSTLWFTEGFGRESFSLASYLLSQTEKLVVATGIAVVFKREPAATAGAAKTLGELFEDRFILGLGVSNPAANARRGIGYGKPYTFMREYLAKMKSALYTAPMPRKMSTARTDTRRLSGQCDLPRSGTPLCPCRAVSGI